MGQRGPKPLPDNVHALRGNPSKKPLAALKNGTRVPVEVPKPPREIKGPAKKIWERTSERLVKLGVISEVDESALVRYCHAYAGYLWVISEIEKVNKEGAAAGRPHKGMITKTPSGYEQQSVLFQIRSKYHDELKSLEAVFGMTPSARSSVDVNPQGDLFGKDDGESGEEETGAAKYFRS